MRVLGILGAHQASGVTAKLLQTVLQGAQTDADVELLNLNDYQIKPDVPNQANPVLDQLEQQLLAADVWVLAAPTYLGGLSGVMKNFLDCMRQRLCRFDHLGNPIPDRFKNKHYISITDCYTGALENYLTGATDSAFRTLDKALTMAGLIKIREIVQTNTWGLTDLSANKKAECQHWGQVAAKRRKRDDSTMKRYLELFGMISLMALVTMGIQQLLVVWIGPLGFWWRWISFVLVFYCLLASLLHFFTVVKHRRR